MIEKICNFTIITITIITIFISTFTIIRAIVIAYNNGKEE